MLQKPRSCFERIHKKLKFLQNALSFNLTQDQKEELRTQLDHFTNTLEHLQTLQTSNDLVESLTEHLGENINCLKKKVIFWIKFQSLDVDVFKFLAKQKGKDLLPLFYLIPTPPRINDLEERSLAELGFPAISYTNEELCRFAEIIFQEQGLTEYFGITPVKLSFIIQRICSEYNVPAYHNFSHGFNVFQTYYYLIKKTGLESVLTKHEVFAALIAALGHDINHKGYNNSYESKVQSKNALAYYDKSILENMHTSVLISVLKEQDVALFDLIPNKNTRKQFKDLIVSVILATDMEKHHKELEKLKGRIEATRCYQQARAENLPIDKMIEEKAFHLERAKDRKRIMKSMIHACDLGSTCQNYETYIYWCSLVSQEFQYQVIKEEKKGVEVSYHIRYQNPASFYSSNINFCQDLALPLWEQLALLFGDIKEAVNNIHHNLKRLTEDKKKAEEG